MKSRKLQLQIRCANLFENTLKDFNQYSKLNFAWPHVKGARETRADK